MTRVRARSEDGFSLVEVMVAIVVLLVGVLGTVMMIDGANANTSRTKAREGGTALARTVLEVARGVPYGELTSTQVLQEMENRAGLQDVDPVTAGHQIESRNFVYTVVPTVCSMDDPKDSAGEQANTGIAFCSDTDPAGTVDRNPDDYRRVMVDLTWDGGGGQPDSTTQVGIVTNPVGALGPSVTSLTPDTPSTETIVSSTQTASYDVTTSKPAAQVAWSINGQQLGTATGEETDWEFEWDLGPHDDPLAIKFVDCTYIVQAEALDDEDRAGAPKALTVTLNRSAPFAPTGLEGGRNLNGVDGDDVDLQWSANRECDVKGYNVYRIDGGVETLLDTVAATGKTEYVDTGAPADGDLTYEISAIDTDPFGDDREGARTQVLIQDIENQRPDPPALVSVCTGGSLESECNDIDGFPAPDGTAVLSWGPATDDDGDDILFYRVYRDGTDYGHRLDVLFPVADPLVFIDSTVTGAHQYWVSTVDEHFGESTLTDPVSWP